jgi:RNA polymerase sigma-70 factor (ECF subfamily)
MKTENIKKIDEFDLIGLCIEGNRNAFEELVRRNQSYAFSLAFRVLTDEDEAKDVVQESFIRIWRHLKNYNKTIKFSTWLYKIVINLCYDRLRVKKRNKMRIDDSYTDIDSLYTNDSQDLEESISNKNLADWITHFSNSLSPKQKIVFVLRDLEGLSIKEVSFMTNISNSSVKTNLIHARKKIKEKLMKIDRERVESNER